MGETEVCPGVGMTVLGAPSAPVGEEVDLMPQSQPPTTNVALIDWIREIAWRMPSSRTGDARGLVC